MNAQRAARRLPMIRAHIAVGEFHGAQLIILAQRDGDQARLAQVGGNSLCQGVRLIMPFLVIMTR